MAVRSVLLYGCETWPIRTDDMRRMESFDNWCLRSIAKVKLADHIRITDLHERCCKIIGLRHSIRKRRLQWFGHVARRDDSVLIKKVLNPIPCPQWKCRRGGQVKTWLDTIKNDVDRLGLVNVYGLRKWKSDWVNICADLSSNRKAWAASIRDIEGAD